MPADSARPVPSASIAALIVAVLGLAVSIYLEDYSSSIVRAWLLDRLDREQHAS
jgi:hypothetical protein